jgi:hypothetical protein
MFTHPGSFFFPHGLDLLTLCQYLVLNVALPSMQCIVVSMSRHFQ